MSFLNSIFEPLSRLGHFWQEKANGRIFRWNLFFIIIQVAYLAWKFSSLPPQVPLYYSLPWGESQLASAPALFILPTISLVLLVINHLFAISLSKTSQLLSKFLIAASLVVSLFSLITLVRIITLVV